MSSSNGNGHSANSLILLEQQLYSSAPRGAAISQLVQGLAVAEPEAAPEEEPQSQECQYQPEAQAFDWDDAIALSYQASESDELADDPPAQQFSLEFDPQEPTESHAFDWDEAIALEYEEPEQPTAESFDWLPTYEDEPEEHSQSLGLDDDAMPFTVEAFAVEVDESLPFNVEAVTVEEEEAPIETVNAFTAEPEMPLMDTIDTESFGFEVTEEISEQPVEPTIPTSQAYDVTPAIPVQATVVSPSQSPQKSAEPIDFDDLEKSLTSTAQSDEASTFAADVAAILRGEKTYEPASPPQAVAVTPEPVAPTPNPASPTAQAQSLPPQPPPKQPSAHDIFDQMGRSMSHATAFDLGTFSLSQTFDEFDAALDAQEQVASFGYEDEDVAPPSETQAAPTPVIAQSLEREEEELAADVRALNADAPWPVALQLQLEEDDITDLMNNHPPKDNELKSQYFTRLKQEAKRSLRQHYNPKLDDKKISDAINQLWADAAVPKMTASPSQSQALDEPFSTSPDEALSPEDHLGEALDFQPSMAMGFGDEICRVSYTAEDTKAITNDLDGTSNNRVLMGKRKLLNGINERLKSASPSVTPLKPNFTIIPIETGSSWILKYPEKSYGLEYVTEGQFSGFILYEGVLRRLIQVFGHNKIEFEYFYHSYINKTSQKIDKNGDGLTVKSPEISFLGNVKATGTGVEGYKVGIIQELKYCNRIAHYTNKLKMERRVFKVRPNQSDLPGMRDSEDSETLPCDGNVAGLKINEFVEVTSRDQPSFSAPFKLKLDSKIGELNRISYVDQFSTWLVVFKEEPEKELIILGRIDWSVDYTIDVNPQDYKAQKLEKLEMSKAKAPDFACKVLSKSTKLTNDEPYPQCLMNLTVGDFGFTIYSSGQSELLKKIFDDDKEVPYQGEYDPTEEDKYDESKLQNQYKEKKSWWN